MKTLEAENEEVKKFVRERYGRIAVDGGSCGCGNPQVIAGLKPGETALDLGSGAGGGPTGRVIGVDMTPEMVSKGPNHGCNGAGRN